MRTDFDVLVAGGGLVGACVAALFAREARLAGLRIALLEARPPDLPPPEGEIDLRVSALSRASERILTTAGAWTGLDSRAAHPYVEMVVWDAAGQPDGPGSIRFSAAETAEPDLGHIVENRRLLWALYGTSALRERVTLLRSRLTGLELDGEAPVMTLEDGRRFDARLVIAADGGHSKLRELAGIRSDAHVYDQHAVVAHVSTAEPHRSTAWQRFLPAGPIAFLPLGDGRSSIVWTTTPANAKRLLALSDAAFGLEVQSAAESVLGAVTASGPRASYPLRMLHSREYCRPGLVLVGDAAHTVHPLAGQGVNLGFLDAGALVQVLAQAHRDGAPLDALGELRGLRRYERWRKSENAFALGLIDGLNRLFSHTDPRLGSLRRTGLELIDRSPAAKRLMIMRALGLAGEVPDAARLVVE